MGKTMAQTVRLLVAATGLWAAACATEDADSTEGDSADGLADDLVGAVAAGKADGWSAIDVELGGSYQFSVVPKQGEQVTPSNAKVLRLTVEPGQSFAAVVRRSDDSELDAFVGLYEGLPGQDAIRVDVSDHEQALVPMGEPVDAVVEHTAQPEATYILFTSDRSLAVAGTFQVDLLAVDLQPLAPELEPAWSQIKLSTTNPALRAYAAQLRAEEPEVSEYVVAGALTEGADGLLVRHEEVLEGLADRHQLRLLTDRINALRIGLFDEFVTAALRAPEPALSAQVGVSCGAVWGGLRQPEHGLR